MSLIIFTSFDGVLLPRADQDYESVKTLVQQLQKQHISLILVTDHTRAEVADLSRKIGLNDPFIVEHGSGVFIPQVLESLATSDTIPIDNYYLYQLGCSYTEARAALKAVQEEINKILRGFGDLDEASIREITGSSLARARQAKAREFSEYFLTPNRIELQKLQEVAQTYGFKITVGEKLSLIMGQGAAVNPAVNWLIQNYQAVAQERVITVGSGFLNFNLASTFDTFFPLNLPPRQHTETKSITAWINSIEEICAQYR